MSIALGPPPRLAKVRLIARGQGYDVRGSRKGTGLYWLIRTGTSEIASPRRGLELEDLWVLIALPATDERVEAVWGTEDH